VPWLSYRVLRGQVYEGVSQVSMGWMLSSVGTALETYGLVAGAAINRQAENTQIQGIYNAEQASAKKGLEAANISNEGRRISSVAGVEGGLVSSLGQIVQIKLRKR
jgi:membrane protease subunit (stomatin/prohibitin family)